jgi:hypothetical protein
MWGSFVLCVYVSVYATACVIVCVHARSCQHQCEPVCVILSMCDGAAFPCVTA